MTSRAWATIERGRKGKRGSSRLRHEAHPPHLRVVCSEENDDDPLPALAFTGGVGLNDYFWVRHPAEPRVDPVTVLLSGNATEPAYVITPGDTKKAATFAESPDGTVLLTAIPEHSRFRTSWTINTPAQSALYTITERKRDALWRRTVGPFTKLSDGAWDAIGLVVTILFLPAALKPPVQMRITQQSGQQVGTVTFGAAGIRPREDFCLYLENTPYPLRDHTLALAALAIVQRMR